MDCAPLNLAHFHERRADKFIKHHRYEEAYKAVETSLLYLQDAKKNVSIPKSIEVLNTQMWDYERKLQQIQMRKQQYERSKLKEIVLLADTNSVMMRPENNQTAQSVAKSIDKTVEDFDAKFSVTLNKNMCRVQVTKENREPKVIAESGGNIKQAMAMSEQQVKLQHDYKKKQRTHFAEDIDEMPTLAPLELPSFDFDVFTTSAPSLACIAGLAESLQK